jgi:hypothetical protein
LYFSYDKLKKSLKHYGKSAKMYEKIEKESIQLADILTKIGVVHKNQGKFD